MPCGARLCVVVAQSVQHWCKDGQQQTGVLAKRDSNALCRDTHKVEQGAHQHAAVAPVKRVSTFMERMLGNLPMCGINRIWDMPNRLSAGSHLGRLLSRTRMPNIRVQELVEDASHDVHDRCAL